MTRIRAQIIVSRLPSLALFAELMGRPSDGEGPDWSASSGWRDAEDVAEVLGGLLERSDLGRLRELVAENGLGVAVLCTLRLEDPSEFPLIALEPDLLSELHALGASLEIELEP